MLVRLVLRLEVAIRSSPLVEPKQSFSVEFGPLFLENLCFFFLRAENLGF